MSYGPFISGNPIIASRAVSTVDHPHPFHSGPPFTPLESHPAGYSSPAFQDVPTQTTFFSMAPGPPSGTSVHPASFCVPPSHFLGRSPASFVNPPSDHRLNMSSASHACLDIQVHDILHSVELGSSSSLSSSRPLYRELTMKAISDRMPFSSIAKAEPPTAH